MALTEFEKQSWGSQSTPEWGSQPATGWKTPPTQEWGPQPATGWKTPPTPEWGSQPATGWKTPSYPEWGAPPQGEGNIAGISAFDPTLDLSASGGGGIGGYSGGGGGGSNAAAIAAMQAEREGQAQRQRDLINSRRDEVIRGINEAFGGQVTELDKSLNRTQNQAEATRGKVEGARDDTVQGATRDATIQKGAARQSYKDLILQSRRRARATGGANSSGFLEITGMLDNQLQQNLTTIGDTKNNRVGAAQKIADTAFTDIELALQEAVDEIDKQKNIGRREKDNQIKDAELSATEALLGVDQWLSGEVNQLASMKYSGGGGGGGGSSSYSASKIDKNAMLYNINTQARNKLAQIDQMKAGGQISEEEANNLSLSILGQVQDGYTYATGNPTYGDDAERMFGFSNQDTNDPYDAFLGNYTYLDPEKQQFLDNKYGLWQ